MTPHEKGQATRKRNAEWKILQRELYAEASRVVATGKCPRCGSSLQRNNALTGWWQCAAFGSPGFRPGFEGYPECSFQTFTEN